MAKNDHTKHVHNAQKSTADPDATSALQRHKIHFEYDRSWAEAKHSVQLRPFK